MVQAIFVNVKSLRMEPVPFGRKKIFMKVFLMKKLKCMKRNLFSDDAKKSFLKRIFRKVVMRKSFKSDASEQANE